MTTVVKSKRPIVIPAAVRKQAGLEAGDRLEFRVAGNVITVSPVEDDTAPYTAAQRRSIDARLRKAEKEIEAGRVYGPFSVDEAIATIQTQLRKPAKGKRHREQRCRSVTATEC
ncbi:MAG: AbrB/MazE/SpoVT family DNA-binding domain-containing protein [Bryobacteraceae bacterium]